MHGEIGMDNLKQTITIAFFLATFFCLPNLGCSQTKSNISSVQNFVNLVKDAQTKSDAKDWKAAAELWNQVVQNNPVEVKFWQKLGEAQFNAKNYREAIPAFQKASELVVWSPQIRPFEYEIARCYALLGDTEQALLSLEKSFQLGFRYFAEAREDSAFVSLRNDARFQRLTNSLNTSRMSRDEGWRYDLQVLTNEVRRRAVSPYRLATKEKFEAETNRIYESIPRLTDIQIIIEFMKLMVLVGDGHTNIYGFWETPELRQTISIEWFAFQEGIFITAANVKYEDLLGAQVLKIGGKEIDEVLKLIDPLCHRDNQMSPRVLGLMRMRHPAILQGLGIIKDVKKVPLTIRDKQGKIREIELPTDSQMPSRRLWDGIPPDWKTFHQSEKIPLYLKDVFKPYWFEYLPDPKTVYFQFNQVRNTEKEDFATFCTRLFKFINETEVEKLVIDLRWNNGGNSQLLPPLIQGIVRNEKINQKGKFFVITGRRTFSAAQIAATLLERNTKAIFVGEPTGSSPNFIGEETTFELPYSKLNASVSDLYWQNSVNTDHRTWIAPLIYMPPTFADYMTNRDSALESILNYQP